MMTAFWCLQVNGGHSPGLSPRKLHNSFSPKISLGIVFDVPDGLVGNEQMLLRCKVRHNSR